MHGLGAQRQPEGLDHLEGGPVHRQVLVQVGVVRLAEQLVGGADQPGARTRGDHRPQGLDLGVVQGCHPQVAGEDILSDSKRGAVVLGHERADGHSNLAGTPGVHEVAEVDQPGRDGPAIHPRVADHVEVGDVTVHHLSGQGAGDGLHRVVGGRTQGADPDRERRVERVDEIGHHDRRARHVPLLVGMRARMVESSQGGADLPGQGAEAAGRRAGQVGARRQRIPGHPREHPDVVHRGVELHLRAQLAGAGGHRHWAAQGQVGQRQHRRVLGIECLGGDRRVGHLEHEPRAPGVD